MRLIWKEGHQQVGKVIILLNSESTDTDDFLNSSADDSLWYRRCFMEVFC